MAKRQLDPFFATARAFTPKPHAPCLVAATGQSIAASLPREISRDEIAGRREKHVERFLRFVPRGGVFEGHFPLLAFFAVHRVRRVLLDVLPRCAEFAGLHQRGLALLRAGDDGFLRGGFVAVEVATAGGVRPGLGRRKTSGQSDHHRSEKRGSANRAFHDRVLPDER